MNQALTQNHCAADQVFRAMDSKQEYTSSLLASLLDMKLGVVNSALLHLYRTGAVYRERKKGKVRGFVYTTKQFSLFDNAL